MSDKEKIYKSIEHIAKCGLYDTIEVNFLKQKFDELQKQNQKYKEVIDKAIELISKEFLCYDNESDEYIQGLKLIDILKELE